MRVKRVMQRPKGHCCAGLLLLLLLSCGPMRGRSQTCAAASYKSCPLALEAAQLLTSNSSYLVISNAAWSGPTAPCYPAYSPPYIIIPSFPSCNYFATKMPQGALVLSSGDARSLTLGSNPNTEASNVLHNTASYGSTLYSDPDLTVVSKSTPPPTLYDGFALTFDLTPTLSGPLAFSYIFGSEDYASINWGSGKSIAGPAGSH
jgi:hypothetical protein